MNTKSLQLVMLHPSSHQLQIISLNLFAAHALQKLHVTQVNVDVWQLTWLVQH